MKLFRLIMGVLVSVFLAENANAAPLEILKCDGYSQYLGGTIEHYIEIYPLSARLDDQLYTITASEIGYTMYGPVNKNWKGDNPSTAPFRVYINRIDGSYAITNEANSGHAQDWSRPEDAGCIEVKQKF